MADVDVTVVFMIPKGNNTYQPLEFPNVTINANAPVRKLIPALVKAFPESEFDEDAELLMQLPDDFPLAGVSIQDKCRLVLFPKYRLDEIVKVKRKPA